jgi:hypothetical protein
VLDGVQVRSNTRPEAGVEVATTADSMDYKTCPVRRTNRVGSLRQRASASSGPLPDGWREEFDEATSRAYWFNENTGESTWERPSADGETVGDWSILKVRFRPLLCSALLSSALLCSPLLSSALLCSPLLSLFCCSAVLL